MLQELQLQKVLQELQLLQPVLQVVVLQGLQLLQVVLLQVVLLLAFSEEVLSFPFWEEVQTT